MDNLIVEILTLYGPLSFGWAVAILIGWKHFKDHETTKNDLQTLITSYHDVIISNTRVIEKLTVLLDERTRDHRNG